jgi:hypothetical protein
LAVIMEMEMQVTPDQYDAVDAALDPAGNPPDGMIAHSARFDGDTLKILDIWESEQAFENFVESRLGPTIGQTLGDEAPPAPQPRYTQLHNAHTGGGG